MTLDLTQGAFCVLVVALIVGAYLLGVSVGQERARVRAARTRRNIEKARKAT